MTDSGSLAQQEIDRLRAALARVEALADRWESSDAIRMYHGVCAREVRTASALDGEDS